MPDSLHRRRLVGSSLVSTLLLVAVGAFLGGSSASGADDADLQPIGVLIPDDGLDPRLADLELTGRDWRRAVERYEGLLFDLAETDRARDASVRSVTDLRSRLATTRRDVRAQADLTLTLENELLDLEQRIAQRAIDIYVRHGEDDLEASIDPTSAMDVRREQALTEDFDASNLHRRDELETDIEISRDREATLEAKRAELELQIAGARHAATVLEATASDIEGAIPGAEATIRTVRRTARVPGSDLTVMALDAYLVAERTLADRDPECGLRWWMLAGVARIESRHGTIGGRVVTRTGITSRPIFGIALDGTRGTRLIADTDDGRIDGDADLDRAVGPFQFIPETWQRLAIDGSGDGRTDPHNLYDAAASAGRYLCRLGDDLSQSANLRRAYFGYNTSSAYVDAVHDWALDYADISF